jgi:hypothetical protein
MSSQTSHKLDGGPGGAGPSGRDKPMTGLAGRLAFAWAFVGIPLAYGVFETAKKASALFTG